MTMVKSSNVLRTAECCTCHGITPSGPLHHESKTVVNLIFDVPTNGKGELRQSKSVEKNIQRDLPVKIRLNNQDQKRNLSTRRET